MIDELELLYNKLNKESYDYLKQKCKENNMFIFARDEAGDTLLHYAVLAEDLNLIKHLIERGSCPYIYNVEEKTPLLLAAGRDNFTVFQYLMEISERCLMNEDKMQLLEEAENAGCSQNVEYLIQKGYGDLDSIDEFTDVEFCYPEGR